MSKKLEKTKKGKRKICNPDAKYGLERRCEYVCRRRLRQPGSLGFSQLWYRVFGSGEFLPSNWVLHLVAEYVCGYNLEKGLCDDFMWLIAGPETAQFNQVKLLD